jgi:hypothetical protein
MNVGQPVSVWPASLLAPPVSFLAAVSIPSSVTTGVQEFSLFFDPKMPPLKVDPMLGMPQPETSNAMAANMPAAQITLAAGFNETPSYFC